jgi:hypothetical protein
MTVSLTRGIRMPSAPASPKTPVGGGDETAKNLDALRDLILSEPLEHLAGEHQELLAGAKQEELLKDASDGELTGEEVAKFAQSVHPSLLRILEGRAELPPGFFLSLTRAAQFPGGNPFMSPVAPSATRAVELRGSLANKLDEVIAHYRQRGGQDFPRFVQLLTSCSHLGNTTDSKAARTAVQEIPVVELEKRNSYLDKFSPEQILAQLPSKQGLSAQKDLVNFDHLLGRLGKHVKGKLLIEIYSENLPGPKELARYVPVTAFGEGSYCVDDIARTTVALLSSFRKDGDARHLRFAKEGLEFVKMLQAPDGEFLNFATMKDGRVEVNQTGETSKKGIDFWAARAIWALGEGYSTLKDCDPRAARQCERAIETSLPRLENILEQYGTYKEVQGLHLPSWLINDASNQTAIVLLGLLAYHGAMSEGPSRSRVQGIIEKFADGIAGCQVRDDRALDDGRFFQTVANPSTEHLWGSRQMQVLALAGRQLGRDDWIQAAAVCADRYYGDRGPDEIVKGSEERIAYGIETVASGFAALYEATGEARYSERAIAWASWLFGNNKAKAVMYDPISGRGYDGIRKIETAEDSRYTTNSNAGAESTVESILALQSVDRIPGASNRLRADLERILPDASASD